jgi:hypothetical protein
MVITTKGGMEAAEVKALAWRFCKANYARGMIHASASSLRISSSFAS